ncbi:16S rRNA (guanine(527)-N(7))-methyltransferase RsmG [Enterovirga rhinocerotis]|uniref:Ribosomal RNA small subunit methyltransferase G n=1 Tax=Enterovirga rhinocerotis TaxID=1339210 RepID=A0A4R7BNP2_9HYPH|nr:16S rRNA (guanine(527)-N(7))-methyltransferase RsmG [Enterovirga rhinocerotis]TDR87118.1 16S rRNA (guanine527-N7)-methyltransferase [Enterovirga rhinocerotis]
MSRRNANGPVVSRETRDRLSIFADELTRWQRALNLVSPASLPDLWTRHIDDSLQLADIAPDARTWVDLGSGGGLPGLIVAAADPTRRVVLVESDSRKCAFLRSTARRMDLSVTVIEARIETALTDAAIEAEVVSARALAPLARLIAYAQPLLLNGAIGLFPKGRNVSRELTEAQECWNFEAELLASRTEPDGRIVRIQNFAGPALTGGRHRDDIAP